jgi:hypothetical protein
MNVIKSFFPFAFTPTPEDLIANTLNTLQINSNAALPDHYYTSLFPDNDLFLKLFRELIKAIPKASNAFALIKQFTIVFKALREKEYGRNVLEILD